jgi:hypothetical protein
MTFWEWDDFIFGLSLHVFAPQASVPQAPFYPGFVALGRLARLVFRDDVSALTAVSAISSCLAALGVWGIARELGGSRREAVSAALLFSFFPAVWFHAGIPLSDDAGLAAALAALWAAVAAGRNQKLVLLAALLFGVAVSVRPQDSVIAVPALLLVGWQRRRLWRVIFAAAAASLALYAIPVALASGGIAPAWAMFRRQTGYVASTDSLAAPGRALGISLRRYGLDIWGRHGLAVLILALAFLGAILLGRDGRKRALALSAASFVPYAALCVIFLDPAVAGRYSLPFLPLAALLSAAFLSRLEERFLLWGLPLPTAALVLAGALTVAPAVRVLHTQASPPVEAAARLRQLAGGSPAVIALSPDLHVAASLLFPGARLIETSDPDDPRLTREPGPVWVFGLASTGRDWPEASWPRYSVFTRVGRGRYLSVSYGRWRPPAN